VNEISIERLSEKILSILVIGGTRFIGFAVVCRLLDLGHEVTLFNRGQTGAQVFPKARHIKGDRRALPRYRGEFAGLKPDVVIDMMLVTEADSVGLITAVGGIAKRIVAISSCDVYRAYGRMIGTEPGPPEATPLREDSPLREKFYPYRGKIERLKDYDKIPIERHLISNADPPATVLRLPMVYGPRDYQHRLFSYLKRMDDKRPVILLDKAVANWRCGRGYVENVAEAIVTAALDARAAGRIYNVAEPDGVTEFEWVTRVGRAAGWSGKIVIVPEGRQPDHSAGDFDAHQCLDVDTRRLRAELDYSEPVALDVALANTVAWERANPPESIDPQQFDYDTEDRLLKEA